MADRAVGLLHPGEMGAAIGAALARAACGSRGRPPGAAPRRAAVPRRPGSRTPAPSRRLARRSDVILSVCPPHAAREVARSVAGFDGIYVDANAIAPATARGLAGRGRRARARRRRDRRAAAASSRHDAPLPLGPVAPGRSRTSSQGTAVDARVVSAEVGAASAVKVAYAAWSKGTAALLLAIRELARAEGVEEPLLAGVAPVDSRSSGAVARAPSGRRRRRAGAGSARWRRSPPLSPPPACRTASICAAAEVFRAFSTEEAPRWPHAVPS